MTLAALDTGGAVAVLLALTALTWLAWRVLRPARTLGRRAEAVAASGGETFVPEGVPASAGTARTYTLGLTANIGWR